MGDFGTAAMTAGAGADAEYQAAITKGLDTAWQQAFEYPTPFRIGTDRMIVFSDLHKGARNGADDFRRCEQAYNAALGYYYTLGYWLVELGDVEELWEESPAAVLERYKRTMDLSAKFHADPARRGTRYLRLWGNHDDEWNRPERVKKLLHPIYCPTGVPELVVHGSVRVPVELPEGRQIGHLFLAHGHQGTYESDKASWFSRLVVRHLWRPFQRLTNISLNTPAKDWELRQKHNRAMFQWATAQPRPLVFIAGHTHKPVFLARTRADELLDQIGQLEPGAAAGQPEALTAMASLSASLEWARAGGPVDTGPEGVAQEQAARYFNSGCCAFRDGDITGIELVEDRIRLVRWPTDTKEPLPKILAEAQFSPLFLVK